LDNKQKILTIDPDLLGLVKEKVKALVESYDDSADKLAMLVKMLSL